MRIKLTENDITNIVRRVLNEIIEEENTPDELTYCGDNYVALEDASFPICFHNGKWVSKGETHRDIMCLDKYGCEECEIDDFYDRNTANTIREVLNNLWSSGDEYQLLSRIFFAKGNAKENGIKYILSSWDELDESDIQNICKNFNINREELIYIPTL